MLCYVKNNYRHQQKHYIAYSEDKLGTKNQKTTGDTIRVSKYLLKMFYHLVKNKFFFMLK